MGMKERMGELGFTAGYSGGGCMWYTKQLPVGYIAITDEGGCGLPEDGDGIMVGVYDDNDLIMMCTVVNDVEHFFKETTWGE